MDVKTLHASLSDLPLGSIRYFDTIGSTNDEAAAWLKAGSPDLSLVIADEQTQGRGRLQRRWFTPPESGLALSLVLRESQPVESDAIPLLLSRLTGLGAVAICTTLQACCQLEAQIKWPNDVLLGKRKVAGILAEAHWRGDLLEGVVLGIGVNVTQEAVPPASMLNFPATCVEAEAGAAVDRLALLHAILEKIIFWRMQLVSPEFLQAWELHLAYKGEWVRILASDPTHPFTEGSGAEPIQEGQLLGLDDAGRLRLGDRSGQTVLIHNGEIRARPSASSDRISR
jgi:BirA family biotin operon repressor/biotin-[acetyl-CoA-carboxylase] ligase